MHLKSQISVEYMLIMGFATMLTLPLLVIYYTYIADSRDSVTISQSLQIERKMVDAAESVYFLGKPSQTTLKVNFPDRIYSINITNFEIVFKVKTKNGITDVVQIASVNMTGNLSASAGIHIVTVKAEDNVVRITSK